MLVLSLEEKEISFCSFNGERKKERHTDKKENIKELK